VGSLDVRLFDFELPEELIAQTPLKERTASRLMVVDRKRQTVLHRQFTDLKTFLKEGDVLVFNDTRVIPARLIGIKEQTGAKIEVLLLKELGENRWEVLCKPAKRVKAGTCVVFGNHDLLMQCEEEKDEGIRIVRFHYEGIFHEILDRLGTMPLPPYIKEQLTDANRYQTVFAREKGSAAAPTAGLHFTEEYMKEIEETGARIAFITLHVGLGTFRPVQTETVEEHKMHAEFYSVSQEAADRINAAKRVIAIGTTVCRTLETLGRDHDGKVVAASGWTDIFIYPGHRFTVVDALFTNFHLPKSSLIMLVSAFAGRELILHAYEEAVRARYRFFSFGDAMLIL
jgi:S-adenosylmethionine:tRNA ribosyltransferase-isomerase